jgi:hypothetical protein
MAGAEVLTHTVGTKAWIKDAEEGWIKCDVVKVDPGLLTVKTERGSVLQAKPEECPLQNPLARAGVEVSCEVLVILGLEGLGCPQCHQV